MEGKEIVTLTSCVEVYLRARKLDGYSDKTLYSYRLHLKRLASDFGDGVPIDTIKLEHLRSHLTSLIHLQTSGLANKVRALKAFFKWVYEEETLERNPALKLREPRLPARIPKALSIEEVELLRDACKSLLEHALVEFFFATGCRVSEIRQLDHIDLDWSRRSVVVLGKGSKEREVYFGAKAALWLKRYLDNRSDSAFCHKAAQAAVERLFRTPAPQHLADAAHLQAGGDALWLRREGDTARTSSYSSDPFIESGRTQRRGAVHPRARLAHNHPTLRQPFG